MHDIPAAIVESARPPLRPAFRKAIIVAVIAVAGGVGWQLLGRSLRSDASKELEARQDRARASVGSALDALFAHQLDVGSTSIELAMRLDGGDTQPGYTAAHCSTGFDRAFSEALGPGVVSFSTVAIAPVPSSRLVIAAKAVWTGHQFRIPSTNVGYAGIEMHADMTFLGRTVHADVVPVADAQFEQYELGISLAGASTTDVDADVIQRTCRQAAYSLLEALTTWKRPAPPPRPDPVKECDDGFHCVDNAEVLEASDRVTAARLYATACDRDDGEACLRGADLEIELSKGKGDHRARAHAMLDIACDKQLANTCAAAGRIALVPVAPGEPVSQPQRHESLVYDLRGCDIGARSACGAAAELLDNTPFADAAALLLGSEWTASRTFGTIFAFRPGEWAKRGPPTIWATRSPTPVPEGAIVTPVAADHVPAGIDVPEGANTVYAVTIVAGPAELARSR
jgi:hypothetical protein